MQALFFLVLISLNVFYFDNTIGENLVWIEL